MWPSIRCFGNVFFDCQRVSADAGVLRSRTGSVSRFRIPVPGFKEKYCQFPGCFATKQCKRIDNYRRFILISPSFLNGKFCEAGIKHPHCRSPFLLQWLRYYLLFWSMSQPCYSSENCLHFHLSGSGKTGQNYFVKSYANSFLFRCNEVYLNRQKCSLCRVRLSYYI